MIDGAPRIAFNLRHTRFVARRHVMPRLQNRMIPFRPPAIAPVPRRLLGDVRGLIDTAREQTARAINSNLVTLYWNIGTRIRSELLRDTRAEYGARVVRSLSERLCSEFGRGYSAANLFHMVRFAEAFRSRKIVYTLCRQLGWSHFRRFIYFRDPLQRDFYAEMCRLERWSVRTLEKKIAGMLFKRTAISRKPAKLARRELAALREEDRLTPDLVFRDP